MRTFLDRRLLVAVLPIAFALIPSAALGAYRDGVSSVEIAQLPRFCWAQYEVPNADGDEYKISGHCPGANHYCPALIYLIRAKGHVKNKNSRLDLLGRADTDIRYTEKAIKDYPKCPIHDHVAASRAEVNNLMNLFGFKRPRAK
jgi:hypothetical protein